MNRAFVFSVLGYFVVTMIVAVLWHLVLFKAEYHAMGAFTRDEPIMPFGMTAIFLQAIIFAYFYPIYYQYKKITPGIGNGIKFSLLMGVNVWTVMVFATAAKFNIEPVWNFVLFATVFQVIQFVSIGVTLGLIHKSLNSEEK